MKYLLFSLCLVCTAWACGSPASQTEAENPDLTEQDAQWRKVMDIHDEVMPKMGLINSLKRDLKGIAEEQPEKQEELTPVIRQLDQAEDSMMEWMYEFKPLNQLRDSMEHPAILQYLRDEEVRIIEVRTLMLNSISAGQNTLEQTN